ncbi:MAG: acetylxylan esterase [Clostridia bacterium]|nr:acetylxylan esterase [Clostridia bacterium]
MPILDMPLEELRAYRGRNECPEDLDAFWDRGLSEIEACRSSARLVPAAFQVPGAECFDLLFTGTGNASLHAHYVRPKGKGVYPAVLHFHGYSGACMDFSQMLGWVTAGFCIASLDCRGQGGSSEDPIPVKGNTLQGHIIRGLDDCPDKLYYRSVFLDTALLARIVMDFPEVDAARVGAYGGSQGGGLTLACAALTPSLNRAAPMMPFLCDYRRVWEMDLAKDAYVELQQYFRHSDPQHTHETEIFTRLGYIDNINLAHRIRARVLMFTGLMDNICPPSTQFAAYNRINSPKSMRIYPDFAHEYYPESDNEVMQFMLKM